MSYLLLGVGIYFVLGGVAISGFELKTHRIRNNWKSAELETQGRLNATGTIVNGKAVSVLLAIASLMFWPAILIGAIKK